MRLKLTRNIGRDDLKAFGLVKEDKEFPAALAKYSEGSVHDFDKETGEALVKRGLAGDDDGVPPPQPAPQPLRGLAPAPAVTAPAPSTFAKNPHAAHPEKDK